MTTYTGLPWDMADAVCDAYGLSLPSFQNESGWTAFTDWL